MVLLNKYSISGVFDTNPALFASALEVHPKNHSKKLFKQSISHHPHVCHHYTINESTLAVGLTPTKIK